MATTTNTTPRITKTQRFEDIRAFLNGEEIPNGSSMEELVAFCDKEIELLAKKNSGAKRPTKNQEENEKYKELIVDFLLVSADGVTCTDIQKNIPEFADFNNQKIAALVRQLCTAGRVTKEVVKGRSYFSIA